MTGNFWFMKEWVVAGAKGLSGGEEGQGGKRGGGVDLRVICHT